ncbi:lipoyl synthase [Psychromonas sp. PRT-SC03]|nr:lipoyl synthase [Psychromonas sp. PRT-SC03]
MSNKPSQLTAGKKLRDADKLSHIPIKVIASDKNTILKKPSWMRIKIKTDNTRVNEIKKALRKNKLFSVCEEASCPNLNECFNHGTATFMILGEICTRRCPFCDVGHGKPLAVDKDEPRKLAETVRDMKLKYVVITSVDRDDLRDGGAQHFADCIREIRILNPTIKIEILVPDFKGRMDKALACFEHDIPDVFNHNLETAPHLYQKVRPGADYKWSLKLLQKFKAQHPQIPTKSGLMMGLGETNIEIEKVLEDLHAHGVTMLTLGQYLQPSLQHLAVERYVPPAEFDMLSTRAKEIGFDHAACGPFVRSSYHADLQASGQEVR